MYSERVRDADKLQCSPVQHAAGVLGQSAYLAVSTRPALDLWQRSKAWMPGDLHNDFPLALSPIIVCVCVCGCGCGCGCLFECACVCVRQSVFGFECACVCPCVSVCVC